MSKGSGGTRNVSSRGRGSSEPVSTPGVSGAQFNSLVEAIAKDGEFDMRVWEELDNNQRDLALMEAGFSGLISEDDYEMGNLYYAKKKDDMISTMAEYMANEATGYGDNDDFSWSIGYKDGTVKTYGGIGNDFDLSRITNRQSWKTQQAVVRSIIKAKDIDFILHRWLRSAVLLGGK